MSLQVRVAELDRLFEERAADAHEAVLVAPYVKAPTVEWLLSLLGDDCRIRLLTRARLQDFVLGASDIECWPLIWARGGEIYLEQTLHAKYYRFNDTVFFGSANVTESALNRRVGSNLELLASHPFDDAFRETEEALFTERILADKDLYKRLKTVVDRYRKDKVFVDLQRKLKRLRSRHDSKLEIVPLPDRWCFQTKHTNVLWMACQDLETLNEADREAALADLRLLRIRPEDVLSREDFRRIMAARLGNWSVVRKLHRCFDVNQTEDRPYLRYGFIRDTFGLEDDVDYDTYQGTVNAFFDWMIDFLPDVFCEGPRRHSRLLGRRGDLTSRSLD